MARRTLDEQISAEEERLRRYQNKLRKLKAKKTREQTTRENRGRFLLGGGLGVLVRDDDPAAFEVAQRIRATYRDERDVKAIDALLAKVRTGGTDDGYAEDGAGDAETARGS